MKTFLSILFCAFVLILMSPHYSYAQSDSTKCFELQGTSDYSFGEIEQDTPVEHTFLFKNKCSDTIRIDNAKASCGCTAAVVSEKEIAPGKTAKIQVKFTPPKGTRGKVSKTVSVFLKGQTQPHTVLRFSADVKSDLDFQPASIQPTAMEAGKPVNGKATVKNVTMGDIEITETTISMNIFADTVGKGATVAIPLQNAKVSIEKGKLKPNESTTVTITFTPTYKGNVNGVVRLKTKKNEAQIQVFGIVAAPGEAKAPGQKQQIPPPVKAK